MPDSQERLARIKELRALTGLTMDFWVDLTEGIPYRSLAIMCGNLSLSPKNRNSKESA